MENFTVPFLSLSLSMSVCVDVYTNSAYPQSLSFMALLTTALTLTITYIGLQNQTLPLTLLGLATAAVAVSAALFADRVVRCVVENFQPAFLCAPANVRERVRDCAEKRKCQRLPRSPPPFSASLPLSFSFHDLHIGHTYILAMQHE